MTEQKPIYVTKRGVRELRTQEILSKTNDLSTGQAFTAVCNHYGKYKGDYPRWISFSRNPGEFVSIDKHMRKCRNDLEKINLACEWLGEPTL